MGAFKVFLEQKNNSKFNKINFYLNYLKNLLPSGIKIKKQDNKLVIEFKNI